MTSSKLLHVPEYPLAAFWKHHPIADQKAESLAEKTLQFQSKFNCDLIKITPAGSWQAVCHGVEDIWNGDFLGRRIITKTIIKDPVDWLYLPDFAEKTPSLMHEIISATRLVKAQTSTPVFSTVFCPVSQAIQMAGLQVFQEHVASNPEAVLAGITKIAQNTVLIIKELIKAGTDGIFFVTQHMRHGAITPEIYKTFGEPSDEQCLQAAGELPFNLFHIHGADIYLSLGNIPSNCFFHYESNQEANIPAEWKHKLGNRLIGGLPASEMSECKSTDQIEQLIKTLCKGSMITAGCVLPLDFPDESLLNWMNHIKNTR